MSTWVRGEMTGGEWLRICKGVDAETAALIGATYAVLCHLKLGLESPAMQIVLDDEDPDLTMHLLEQDEYDQFPAVKARRFLHQMRQEIEALRALAEQETRRGVRFDLLREVKYMEGEYAANQAQMLGLV